MSQVEPTGAKYSQVESSGAKWSLNLQKLPKFSDFDHLHFRVLIFFLNISLYSVSFSLGPLKGKYVELDQVQDPFIETPRKVGKDKRQQ